ncbi:nucleoporin Nup120/160-domain-containing protein [Naematelia encephala]|uniref:Nucleoporin Nup120/160-domain-containing protein n=1 Tax=Naematelia encephala TaxID=71784 RepID=A0A1Y2B942_9TREE|nr:nucleoporin Nup120/160-domain-containing protein [Naematelia encephala]
MPSTYIPYQLVHAHLPPPPSIPNSIPELRVPSAQPFPTNASVYSDPLHPDHAVSTAYDPSTCILARSIHNAYCLELRSFALVIDPNRPKRSAGSEIIRIFFPSPLRPLVDECIVLHRKQGKVYILLVSEDNVIYRLSFPLGDFEVDSGDRFDFSLNANEEWCEEYSLSEEILNACGGLGAWTVLNPSTVVLGCADGGIVKAVRSHRGAWSASHHRATSRLRIGSLFSRSGSAEQIIAFGTHEDQGELAVTYTLSRDRKLRTWNSRSGALLRTQDVRSSSSSQDLIFREPTTPTSSSSSSTTATLPETSVALIRTINHPLATSRYSHLVIVFLATPFSPIAAGSFFVYRATSNGSDLSYAGECIASSASAGSELRGFEILPPTRKDRIDTGWQIWATWDRNGVAACDSVCMDDIFQFTSRDQGIESPLLTEWQTAYRNNDVERFDAAYFDNLLGLEAPNPADLYDHHDIPDTFLSHLFHPGRFSSLSLMNALDQYIESSLMGQPIAPVTSSLRQKYDSIIGAHLVVQLDPQTGAPVVDAYREKLKLEWLSVWSSVKELDKQARWPVSTSYLDDQLIVHSREGFSAVVPEEASGILVRLASLPDGVEDFEALPEAALDRLYPNLASRTARSSALAISATGHFISSALSSQRVSEQGDVCLEALSQFTDNSLAKGFEEPPERLAMTIWDSFMDSGLTEEECNSTRRLLSECPDWIHGLSESLEVVTDGHLALDGTASSQLSISGSANALITSVLTQVIAARYTLSRNILLVSLFVLAESPEIFDQDDENAEALGEILTRAFVAYHRWRVLKWLCESRAEEAQERRRGGKRKGSGGDDALADGLGSLNVGENQRDTDSDSVDTTYSLLHTLLADSYQQAVFIDSISSLLEASFAFLASTNLIDLQLDELESRSSDVKLAKTILTAGHPMAAGEITDLYPLSSGMAYVKGRAYLSGGGVEQAIALLQQASAGIKDGSLQAIMPSCSGEDGLTNYWRHVARIFQEHGVDAAVVRFGHLALRSAPGKASDMKDVWTKVFLANVSLGSYEDAYSVLCDTPHHDLRQDFLGQLISIMCEANEVGRLNSLGFVGFQKDVEVILDFKARNSDPLRFPNYYKVLYSWHISRGDYRTAAQTMYLQGRRLGSTSKSVMSGLELATMQARSYLAAINALALVDKRNAWVSVPSSSVRHLRGLKRRRITSYVPEDQFAEGKRAVDIVTLADMQLEYTQILSRLQLAPRLSDLQEHGVTLTPDEVVGLFVQQGMFDLAQSSAVAMKVDMSDLFHTLATRCVELSRSPSMSLPFLQSSPITARLRGAPAALAMRYLQVTLSRHDSKETQWRYREVVADTLFELNQDNSGWQMPAWLVEWEMARDPVGWISRALQWGWISEAVDWSAQLLRNATPPELLPKGKDNAANIPYNLFDRVVAAAAEGEEGKDEVLKRKVETLQDSIRRRKDGLKSSDIR